MKTKIVISRSNRSILSIKVETIHESNGETWSEYGEIDLAPLLFFLVISIITVLAALLYQGYMR